LEQQNGALKEIIAKFRDNAASQAKKKTKKLTKVEGVGKTKKKKLKKGAQKKTNKATS